MPRGDLGRIGIIPACAGNTVFDALTHDDVPLHEHFERQRARFAEVATARDLVPLRGLELVRLDGRQLLEQHREPLFGNKKPPRRTACAAVGFAPTSPQSRALLVLCYFPCFLFSHMSVTLSTMARSSGVSLAAPFAESGSSPRVRGTPLVAALAHQHQGIIPARAGNTAARRPTTPTCRDHPRVCGEHMRMPFSM